MNNRVTIQLNKFGHIELWRKEREWRASKESDAYFQAESDVQAIVDGLAPSERIELNKGWAIHTRNVDDELHYVDAR